MNPVIITTSWDDGHTLDLRVAELLDRYGLKGTFYVPIALKGKAVDIKSLVEPLHGMAMEIGSHTLTHPVLTTLTEPRIETELRDSKIALEQMLGRPVSSFCYPKGVHSRRIAQLSKQAGYALARTTVGFRTGLEFEPARMPVSLQICPQRVPAIIRHAVKEANWGGLLNWCSTGHCGRDLVALSKLFLAQVRAKGGVLHLWGHSWELERYGLWETFEEILKHVSGTPGAQYLTNAGTLAARHKKLD